MFTKNNRFRGRFRSIFELIQSCAGHSRPVRGRAWLYIRAAMDRHWAAPDANDFEAAHQIYREDAVLEYPQSGEHIRIWRNIQESRFAQPNRKRFTVRRIIGVGRPLGHRICPDL
jgi:hypothetical protein